jgi:hypothetical protein
LLLSGLLFIVYGLTVFESSSDSWNQKIAAAAGVTLIFASIVCCIMGRGSDSPRAALSGTSAADSEEIEVDRKLSKKSVSTIASSRCSVSSTVIYHAPSNSFERVIVNEVGNGDVEQGLAGALRN